MRYSKNSRRRLRHSQIHKRIGGAESNIDKGRRETGGLFIFEFTKH